MSTQIDLYRIVQEPSVWTLKQGKGLVHDAGFGDEFYAPTAISRNRIEQKNEISKASLEVSIPIDHEIALSLLTSYTETVMTISVFTKTDATVEISWKGRLSSIKPGDDNLVLNFESVFTSMRRPGLRARFQRSCRHPLYGRGCGLDFNEFAVAGTVDSIIGTTLTVPEADAQADGYFDGGMIAALDGSLSYIISHVADKIILQRVGYSLITDFALTGAGTVVTLYPGCKHTRADCNTKFDNLLNYGGFDWIPLKNPMGGSSIV